MFKKYKKLSIYNYEYNDGDAKLSHAIKYFCYVFILIYIPVG